MDHDMHIIYLVRANHSEHEKCKKMSPSSVQGTERDVLKTAALPQTIRESKGKARGNEGKFLFQRD